MNIPVSIDFTVSGATTYVASVVADEYDLNTTDNAANAVINVTPVDAVTATEQEFQAQINAQIAAHPEWDIDFALVDLVPGAMNFAVQTADGTVGDVVVSTAQNVGFVSFQIDSISVTGAFTDTINHELLPLITSSLDAFFEGKVGAGRDMETLTITDMQIDATFVSP